MPGCGESEGPRGNLICLEQVQAASDALTFLAKNPNVEGDRIGMIGSSFGAAIAVYVCGVDKRVAAAISSGGWGDGERKFRGQHPGEAAWKKFTDMLAEGKRHREKTGKSLMVPRYDIVPIPEHLRGHLAQNSILEFTAETAQSMYDFRADDVIGKAAGRPILLLHSSVDSVTPTEQSIEMFKRASQPCDLHLFAETDHFMFAESNTRVRIQNLSEAQSSMSRRRWHSAIAWRYGNGAKQGTRCRLSMTCKRAMLRRLYGSPARPTSSSQCS